MNFCNEQDRSNPWNMAYKIIKRLDTHKINSTVTRPDFSETTNIPGTLQTIADYFLLEGIYFNPITINTHLTPYHHPPPPPFTLTALDHAFHGINPRKAPGPDGLDGTILLKCYQVNPGFFLDLYNKCLATSAFPTNWKNGTVILLKKPNQLTNTLKQYRPICLLNNIG